MYTRIRVSRAPGRSGVQDAKRRAAAQHLSASRAAELAYALDLRRILGQVHAGVLHVVAREGLIPGRDARQDAPRARLGLGPALVDRIVQYVRPETGRAFDKMAAATSKKATAGLAKVGLIPIAPHKIGLDVVIARARDRNISLVEKAGRAYAQDVRDVIGDPANFGLDPEDLAEQLVARGNVSLSRATLVARDQTTKLNAALVEHRARAAGVTRYVWSTSLDERVRPDHAAVEGKECYFGEDPRDEDPRPVDTDGSPMNPGEPVQCRCVAVPILDDDAAIDDEPPEDVAAE